MCMKTECKECGKPTWKGCGKHIEQALKDVPQDERCKCPRELPEPTPDLTKNVDSSLPTTTTATTEDIKSDDHAKTNDNVASENKVEEAPAKTNTDDETEKQEAHKEESQTKED
ncbi:unnamed protein product [Adineta ricciae]|uniref:Uncharacterized protein n=1 Tax=Adineta ricciae TaxID=249248 RepID=A0A814CDG6_ADIRI|nr:unnamed protein product [Adineta ricciae]CAF0941808.1 unnamed protein product [Adineta ricciae]